MRHKFTYPRGSYVRPAHRVRSAIILIALVVAGGIAGGYIAGVALGEAATKL